MMIPTDLRGRGSSRRGRHEGKILVMFGLLLPVLLGVVGLVIDSGLLMAAQRQAQNAADAAALAAAMDLYRGATPTVATTTANTFMANNGLSGVTLTLNGGTTNAINTPPQTGPHSTASIGATSSAQYAEAYVTKPVTTTFIQVLGVNQSQSVTARAVAGYETVGNGEGAILLNPNVAPGLTVSGGSRLVVNGTLVVNSQGKGLDQYGNSAGTLATGAAISTGNSLQTPAPVVAQDIQVVGGIDVLDNFRDYDSAFGPTNWYDSTNPDRPVFANAGIVTDPLQSGQPAYLVTPTTTNTGDYQVQTSSSYINNGTTTNFTFPTTPSPNIANGTVTFNPGIYASIKANGGTLTFNPGIYVIYGGQFSLSGQAIVTGTGVMFYITGSDYVPTTGLPDANDGTTLGSDNNAKGSFSISGQSSPGSISLSGINDPTGPFNQMLIYQRRWDSQTLTISATTNVNLDSSGLGSVTYAKWANLVISGGGKYNAQFIVGQMTISGASTLTLNAAGHKFGKANVVFLVE